MTPESRPIRLALVDDYEVVLSGVANMFDQYRDRVEVAVIAIDEPITIDVDIALYDTFAQGEADNPNLGVLVASPRAARVVVYTWVFRPELVERAFASGADGYLAKTLAAAQLVDALERIHGGERVVSPPPASRNTVGLDWPGRTEGLTERESEVIALITQGRTNAEIADMTYLSLNSVKTHIRNAYRKTSVARRSQAVLWGVAHGFKVDHHCIDNWRT